MAAKKISDRAFIFRISDDMYKKTKDFSEKYKINMSEIARIAFKNFFENPVILKPVAQETDKKSENEKTN